MDILNSDIHHHNWVTYILGKFFLRTRERQASYKLYSYLRQVDDFIDEGDADSKECLEYIAQQRKEVRTLYTGNIDKKESLLGQIIAHDRQNGNKFQKCINLMMDVFEFDARRKGKSISDTELQKYSLTLAQAYTRFLVYFMEPRYKHHREDVMLAHACHLVHMIRDLPVDQDLGYYNIPQEDIDTYKLTIGDFKDKNLCTWLFHRVKYIKDLTRQGKVALCKNPLLIVKLMGFLYCFRYESVLNHIQRAGYRLRKDYPIRFIDCLRLFGQCLKMGFDHVFMCMGF